MAGKTKPETARRTTGRIEALVIAADWEITPFTFKIFVSMAEEAMESLFDHPTLSLKNCELLAGNISQITEQYLRRIRVKTPRIEEPYRRLQAVRDMAVVMARHGYDQALTKHLRLICLHPQERG